MSKQTHRKPANEKSQTAVEYLATYGWDVLIIAIVLFALFQLGILTFIASPKQQPGTCYVSRPEGPGTMQFMTLAGVCNNAMPEYVMGAHGTGDYVLVPGSNTVSSRLNLLGTQVTVTAWIKIFGAPYHDIVDKENQYGLKIDLNNQPNPCYPSNNTGLCLEWDTYNNWGGVGPSEPIIPGGAFNEWIFIAGTMNGKTKNWYANGNFIGSQMGGNTLTYINSQVTIGSISPGYTGYGDSEWFNGTIANVQIYNASLTANEIYSLYYEGIGGAPINIQNLVGWWPLNGDTNDYSENGGGATGVNSVTFTNVWTSGYTTP